ncbi:hypothetical protein [Saccharopolyspora pogona]|uniref:hypothetical protein n=1 Tax=Saccharopolyspora pogona TaxID=333966 RepID=UPI0016873536|nr:hypothetical protein [Saccharopolyspora pogona]
MFPVVGRRRYGRYARPERYRGKNPQLPLELRGTDLEVLSKEVSAWITLPNKVAHRCMPQITDPYFDSNAASPTIQAG